MALVDPEEHAEREKARGADRIVAHSAGRLAKSAQDQEYSADRRTRLAADRTLLAAERTYAAWMRTGLAALAAGVGARALLKGDVSAWLATATSAMLVVFAVFCFVAGVWRELRGAVPSPRTDMARLPAWVLLAFNGFLVLVCGAVLVNLVWS